MIQVGGVLSGEPLAQGRTADVYAWGDGWVLKLFHDWFERESVHYEARLARAVHASGLPVPAVGAMVRVNGRDGLLYRRVEGPSMWEVLQRKPWRVLRHTRRLAALQAEMHAQVAPSAFRADVPAQRENLQQKIRNADGLPVRLEEAVLRRLAAMPEGDRICHGDFHPGNVLLSADGAVVIDWIDATSGRPLADVARTTIISLGAAAADQVPGVLMKGFVRLFHAAYLREYFRLRPGGEGEYRRWLPVVAAARLSEGMGELEAWLVEQAGTAP